MSDEKELENTEGTFAAEQPESKGYPETFEFKCPFCCEEHTLSSDFVVNLKPAQTLVDLPCRCVIAKYRLEQALEAA